MEHLFRSHPVEQGAKALSSVSVLTNALRLRRIAPVMREEVKAAQAVIDAVPQPAE